MTHTLHPEIEEAIHNLDNNMRFLLASDMLAIKDIPKLIKEYLGPYLHMPTDLKDSEQSIPKIEEYKIKKLDRELCRPLQSKELQIMEQIIIKQGEIIDRLNTLPTK